MIENVPWFLLLSSVKNVFIVDQIIQIISTLLLLIRVVIKMSVQHKNL